MRLERLEKALHRLKSIMEIDRQREHVMDLLDGRNPKPEIKVLALKRANRTKVKPVEEIIAFTVDDKLTFAHTEDQTYHLSFTLSELEERLNADQFMRVHRSVIVNLKQIKEIDDWKKNSYRLTLKNEMEVDVSRRNRKELKQRLHL